MNASILKISGIVILGMSLIFSGCMHLKKATSFNCAVPVYIDLTVETHLYRGNDNNLRLKLTIKTSEGVINNDFKLYNGMNIFIDGYENAILAVEDIDKDNAVIKNVLGFVDTYHIGDGWENEFPHVKMLKKHECN